MENKSIIESKKEQKFENKVMILGDISEYLALFFFFYLGFVAVTLGWSYLFRFEISWPTGEEYPSWKVGLFGATYEPLTKDDWGRISYCDVFEDYNSFSHLFQVVTLFYFLPFLAASIMLCFVRTKKWRLIIEILFGVIIISLQILFGYLCHAVWQTQFSGHYVGTVWHHILLFGGFGVFLAVAYGLILNRLYKAFAKSEQIGDKIKAILFAHLLAYLALSMVLASYWFSLLAVIVMALFLLVVSSILYLIFLLINGLAIIVNKIIHRKNKS